MNVDPATIAWSVYNALAVFFNGPTEPEVLLKKLQTSWSADLDGQEFADAVDELVSRKFVKYVLGRIDLVDEQRRALATRARPTNDSPGDGWDGWELEREPGKVKKLVLMKMVPSQPIEEVLS
jgi:hypothetical protein